LHDNDDDIAKFIPSNDDNEVFLILIV
jgi:hypothetical protein